MKEENVKEEEAELEEGKMEKGKKEEIVGEREGAGCVLQQLEVKETYQCFVAVGK